MKRRLGKLLILFIIHSYTSSSAMAESDLSPAREAGQFLSTYCSRCHRGNLVFNANDLSSVLDIVTPGKPEQSDLWLAISKGGMLKRAVRGKHLSPEQRNNIDAASESVKRWIASGAKIPESKIKSSTLEFDSLVNLIENDTQFRRKTVFYVFMNPFQHSRFRRNGVSLAQATKALNKSLNGVSWNPEIKTMEVVKGSHSLLYRFDIRDYRISLEDFRFLIFNETLKSRPSSAVEKQSGREFFPLFYGDRLLKLLNRNDIYNRLLFGQDSFLFRIREKLGIDIFQNIKKANTIRYGILRSGVSSTGYNRMIERHAIEKYEGGGFWLSYDFIDRDHPAHREKFFETFKGRTNIFKNPTGPVVVLQEKRNFQPDGGEIIYNLPNGLQAYALINQNFQLLTEAPIEVVRDPQNGAIRAPYSCHSCHAQGLIPVKDELWQRMEQNILSTTDLAKIKKKHVENVRKYGSDIQQLDTSRHLEANLALGIPLGEEPITNTIKATPRLDKELAKLMLWDVSPESPLNEREKIENIWSDLSKRHIQRR